MNVKGWFKSINSLLVLFGIDIKKTINSIRDIPFFLKDYQDIKKQQPKSNQEFTFGKLYPCLGDRFTESGTARGHYFHQDLLVARKVFSNSPIKHVDIGSRIDGFVAHIASFRSLEVIDIRFLSNKVPNVKFIQADLMGAIEDELYDYCDSLSCLHAIEHFGLGRYGDSTG